ncbi:TerC/Alx family metal homeostasis membrane protein [uncultured Pseudokineococcus sp.]|uniref:TerC/Alx family metal homeostasis membrane protein n=1 Tax=uncultured Pseudokineococcus sp. TaxID=1642928 RepID=UPI002626B9E6|nr:TerC/Alx family metal homeostasis membrane protein [uncultured Pseudokineococcus sp.]
MSVPGWLWAATIVAAVLFLTADVLHSRARPHVPSTRESATHLAGFVGAAVLFGLGLWWFAGGQAAGEFYAGWLTEYSLSVDNLFIFLLIFRRFAVPRELQQNALLIGIVLALVLRAVVIAVGATLISAFSWVFFLFGAFLLLTAVNLVRGSGHDAEEEFTENRLVGLVRRVVPVTPDYRGTTLVVSDGGRRAVTPMLLVLVALGTTDLLFALDSIPAIFGLTSEPYIVLTANLFALMGLRQLFFLVGDLLKKLIYLDIGLAVLLAFVGVKLILEALHENTLPFLNGGEHVEWAPEVPIWLSLSAIVVILGTTAAVSLLVSGRRERAAQRG